MITLVVVKFNPDAAGRTHNFMKCTYCGRENPEDATLCQGCGAEFAGPAVAPPVEVATVYEISPAERRFWEKMTFRQFAIFLIRLQSLWLIFEAVSMATYFRSYLYVYKPAYSFVHLELKSGFYAYVFRIILHVAAAVICIQQAERIISWFVKDMVPKEAPEPPLLPGAAETVGK
jgi:hypothetical protein